MSKRLDKADRELLALSAQDGRSMRIGDEVLYPPLMVNGRPFQFDPWQNAFLVALQKNNGDIDKACRVVMKPIEWAKKFITSRKFREFRNAKIQSMVQRSGEMVDWWWEMGLSGARGYTEWYEGTCGICNEENRYTLFEAETFRQDDMSFRAVCKICLQPMAIEYKQEPYKPTREMVQFWSEIGNRVVPKIERVAHEFTNETFQFQTEEA